MNKHRKIALSMAGMVCILLVGIGDAEAKRRKVKPVAFRGVITALSPQSVSLGNRLIQLTPRTKYEDFVGVRVSLSAFAVGDCVKIKLVPNKKIETAREMELEDHCTKKKTSTRSSGTASSSSSSSSDDSSSSSSSSQDCYPDDDDDHSDHRGRGRGRGGQ